MFKHIFQCKYFLCSSLYIFLFSLHNDLVVVNLDNYKLRLLLCVILRPFCGKKTAQLLYIVKHDWRDSLINYECNSHYSEQLLTQFIKHVMHICCKHSDFT